MSKDFHFQVYLSHSRSKLSLCPLTGACSCGYICVLSEHSLQKRRGLERRNAGEPALHASRLAAEMSQRDLVFHTRC